MADVTVKDFGWDKWQRGIRELVDLEVVVGVVGDAALTPHEDLPGGPPGEGDSDSEATLADIAYINEFGSNDGHVPERPAHRTTFEASQAGLERRKAGALRLVGEGKAEPKQQLERIGAWYAGELKAEIIAFSDPGNAESTIEQKGDDNPLIDTGRYVNAINYVVQEAGTSE